MMKRDWTQYYRASADKAPANHLLEGLRRIESKPPWIAVDCGCGTGTDAMLLLERGFLVHAFDIDRPALALTRARVGDDPRLRLECESFERFEFPESDLVNASDSLFFCSSSAIENVIESITKRLKPGGVFCGNFLGVDDSWRVAPLGPATFVSSADVRRMFARYDLISHNERRRTGNQASGGTKFWHTHTIVARRPLA